MKRKIRIVEYENAGTFTYEVQQFIKTFAFWFGYWYTARTYDSLEEAESFLKLMQFYNKKPVNTPTFVKIVRKITIKD